MDPGDEAGHQRGEAAGEDQLGVTLHLATHPDDQALHQAGVAEDEAGLHGGSGVAPEDGLGRCQLDAREPGRPLHQGVMADHETGGHGAAQVVAGGVDGVDGGGGPEVADDGRTAVEVLGGDGIGDPIGSDQRRVVVVNADAGPDTRSDDERGMPKALAGELVDAPGEVGDHIADHDRRNRLRLQPGRAQQGDDHQPQLCSGRPGLGVQPEIGDQPAPVEDTDDGVGVADVDGEQHRGRL